jgi:meso-butanediol dehydrogenase/(S,S)-butanediol dehydrogenase/diacetyl reductase
MFDFTDKRVLVTGGARGIGAATVAAFLAQGARVAVGSRSRASYESFAAATDSTDICAAIGDVSDQAGARAVVDAAIRGLGGLDILVNSAGIFAEVAIGDITQEHWNATLGHEFGGNVLQLPGGPGGTHRLRRATS